MIELIILVVYACASYLAYLDDKNKFQNNSLRFKLGNIISGLFLGTLLFSFLYVIFLIYFFCKNYYNKKSKAKI